jgi:hypothetical protein
MSTTIRPVIKQVVLLVAVFGGVASIYSTSAAFAQLQGDAPGTQSGSAGAQEQNGLNLFLKLNDEHTGTSTTQPVDPMNPGANAGANGTRNLNVNVTVVQGEKQMVLPLNVTIPTSADDVELCAFVANGTEVCQAILVTLDLTENATDAASIKPAAYVPVQDSGGLLGDGSLIHIEDTNVFIPVTVIVPLTVQIQNAQVCASVLSSGEMNCTQAVLNPSQTSYTVVDVDVSSATPEFSSQPTTATAEQTPTTQPSSNTTGTDTGTTTSDTGDDTGTTTAPSGDGNTTNSTG